MFIIIYLNRSLSQFLLRRATDLQSFYYRGAKGLQLYMLLLKKIRDIRLRIGHQCFLLVAKSDQTWVVRLMRPKKPRPRVTIKISPCSMAVGAEQL